MATDRDSHARVLDKRFNPLAYRLHIGVAEAVSEICAYIVMRDHEADKDLPGFFKQAHQVLSRQMQPLFPDRDAESDAIREYARTTQPAMRLGAAFEDVRKSGGDVALAYARRQVRWLEGCLNTQPDWPDARRAFAASKHKIVEELAIRHRRRYLEMETPVRKARVLVDQSALVNEKIPLGNS